MKCRPASISSGVAVAALLAVATPAASQGGTSPNSLVKSEQCLECHGNGIGPLVTPEVSHRYGIDYVASRRNRRHLSPASSPSGFGGTIAEDLLVDGRVECVSCHVMHEVETAAPFRLRSENPVDLCSACHDLDG
jgi:predicted CXXCH cytochrome family protein